MTFNARWTSSDRTSIRVEHDDGSVSLVPRDPANSDFAALLGAKIAIADYVAPPAPVPAITPLQAALWLAQHGKSDADVMAVINAMTDATARLSALATWSKAPALRIDIPLIATLWAGLGLKIPAEQAFREAAAIAV